MTINADAVFQNGQFHLKQPIALADGAAVHLAITPIEEDADPLAGVIGICDNGPPISLAQRHDEFAYGLKPRSEPLP